MMIAKKTDQTDYPYNVAFQYDWNVINSIKEKIAYSERRYNPSNKTWSFTERGFATLRELYPDDIELSEEFEMPLPSQSTQNKPIDSAWTLAANKWFEPPYKPSEVQRELLSKDRPDGYGLFYGVGCGKTASSVCEFFKRKTEGRAHKMMVIVCIAGLRFNWQEDIKKLFGMEVDMIDGTLADRLKQINAAEKMIAITPYTTCGKRELVEAIAEKYDMIAIDEIHLRVSDKRTTKVKNKETDETSQKSNDKEKNKRVMSEFGGMSYLAKHVKNRLALTGTVAPNKPTNCFTALHIIDPEKFPSKYKFEQRFCIYGGYMGKTIIGYKNMKDLKNALAYYGMFASKKQYLDIPRKTEEVRYVDISENTEKAIRSQLEVVEQNAENYDLLKLKDWYIKIHETFSCPSKTWGFKSDKLKALKAVLEDVPLDEKVIIFTGLKACVDEVMECLGDDAVAITGDMTDKSVEKAKDEFKSKKRYLVATIQKMGAGFNLQHANHVIFMDTISTGAQIEQGLGRVHRSGQDKETHVTFIITRTPFEMNRLAMIEEQRQIMDKIEDVKQDISPQIMRRLLSQVLKKK